MNSTNSGLTLTLSNLLAAEGNKTGAVAVLEKALGVAPNESALRYSLGVLRMALGQPDLAVSNWQIVATNDPSFPWSHSALAYVYRRAGRLADTLVESKKYAERLPEDPLARNDLGYTYYLLGQYDQAIREYQAGIGLDPNNGLIHYNLAVTYNATGRKSDAINACLKARACGYLGDPRFLATLSAPETK
jgi:tetratricopeptide (TPR) repeat protein